MMIDDIYVVGNAIEEAHKYACEMIKRHSRGSYKVGFVQTMFRDDSVKVCFGPGESLVDDAHEIYQFIVPYSEFPKERWQEDFSIALADLN